MSYKTIDRSLKTAPLVTFPVNPYCWSKSAEHDVTLTSLTADLLWPGTQFFDTRCGIVAWRGMTSLEAKFPVPQARATLNGRTTLCPYNRVYSVEMGGQIQSNFFFTNCQHDSQQRNWLTKNAYILTWQKKIQNLTTDFST